MEVAGAATFAFGLASAGAAHRIPRRLRSLDARRPARRRRTQQRATLCVPGRVHRDSARVDRAAARDRIVGRDSALLHVVRLRKLLPLSSGMGGSFRFECKFCRESAGPRCVFAGWLRGLHEACPIDPEPGIGAVLVFVCAFVARASVHGLHPRNVARTTCRCAMALRGGIVPNQR